MLTSSVLLGIVRRLNWDGKMVESKPERLDGNFGFTGFKWITAYIFLWPFLVFVFRKKTERLQFWFLNYFSFLIWQYSFLLLERVLYVSLDPSGHICATMISVSLLKPNKTEKNKLVIAAYYALLVHSTIGLHFTAYVFHTVFESIVGLFFAYFIHLGCKVVKKSWEDVTDSFIDKVKWKNEVNKLIS